MKSTTFINGPEIAVIDELVIELRALGRSTSTGYGVALEDPFRKIGYIYWWASREEYVQSIELARSSTKSGIPKTCLEFCSNCDQYPSPNDAVRALVAN